MYLSSNWPTYPALIQVGPGPLWKASWAGCIRFFTGHKYPPAAQLTASMYWKYNKNRLVPDLTKQCIKGSTELYCLFIAADNIVDTISFMRCTVLRSTDPRTSYPQIWIRLDLSSSIEPGPAPDGFEVVKSGTTVNKVQIVERFTRLL